MTMRARGTNAARTNAGVYSGEHGQRRLLLWSAAARAGRRWLPAALVRGSRCAGVPCLVYFLFLSRSGARNPFGAWGGGVSRRWPRGRRYRGRERGKAGKAREHFPGGVERTREPVARHGNDCEAGIPARKISGGHAGTGLYGK